MIVHCSHDALVSVKELKPNPLNRNSHPKDQVERLAKILEFQGWRYPIKVSKRSGLITSGHGRLEAAKLLKWKEVPVSFQDYDSEEQEYADTISDNSIASWSELDLSGINSDLTDLGPDFDIDLLGIKDFVLEPVEKLEPQCDEDEIPDALPEPKVVKGEVYILGNHRLMCGDSTAITDVERLMDGKKADMVFTDPPYQLQTQGGGLLKESLAMKKIKELGIDEFDPSILIAHSETSVFCCNKPLIPSYIRLADDWGVSWDLAVYHKKNITPNYGGHLMTDLEYIFVIGKQSPRTGIGEDKELYSKLYSGGKDQDNETAWSKPVALCEKFIKLYSERSVLDVFGGSGSTLIACEKTDRHCFMMELDPHYCGVILDRWQKFTGRKAHREDGMAWDEIKAGVTHGQTS